MWPHGFKEENLSMTDTLVIFSAGGWTHLSNLQETSRSSAQDVESNIFYRPFAQLLPGLETGHPLMVGQSPAYDFSVSDEQKALFLASVSDCSEWDSCAGDWPTVTGCPVSNPGNNCANGLLSKVCFAANRFEKSLVIAELCLFLIPSMYM